MKNKVKHFKRGKMYYYPTEEYLSSNDNVSAKIYLGTQDDEKEIERTVGFYETYEEAKEAAEELGLVSDKRLKMIKYHKELLEKMSNRFYNEYKNIIGNKASVDKDDVEIAASISYQILNEDLGKMVSLLDSVVKNLNEKI